MTSLFLFLLTVFRYYTSCFLPFPARYSIFLYHYHIISFFFHLLVLSSPSIITVLSFYHQGIVYTFIFYLFHSLFSIITRVFCNHHYLSKNHLLSIVSIIFYSIITFTFIIVPPSSPHLHFTCHGFTAHFPSHLHTLIDLPATPGVRLFQVMSLTEKMSPSLSLVIVTRFPFFFHCFYCSVIVFLCVTFLRVNKMLQGGD